MSFELFPSRLRALSSEEIIEFLRAETPYDLDCDELEGALCDLDIDPEFPGLTTSTHHTLPGRWFKTPQFARALARTDETIRDWEKNGVLPPSEFSVGIRHGLRRLYSLHQTRWAVLVAYDSELIAVDGDGQVRKRQPDATKLQSFSVGIRQGWACADSRGHSEGSAPSSGLAGSPPALAFRDNPVHDLFHGCPVGAGSSVASWPGPSRPSEWRPYRSSSRG